MLRSFYQLEYMLNGYKCRDFCYVDILYANVRYLGVALNRLIAYPLSGYCISILHWLHFRHLHLKCYMFYSLRLSS